MNEGILNLKILFLLVQHILKSIIFSSRSVIDEGTTAESGSEDLLQVVNCHDCVVRLSWIRSLVAMFDVLCHGYALLCHPMCFPSIVLSTLEHGFTACSRIVLVFEVEFITDAGALLSIVEK